jgi:hypothetical protein
MTTLDACVFALALLAILLVWTAVTNNRRRRRVPWEERLAAVVWRSVAGGAQRDDLRLEELLREPAIRRRLARGIRSELGVEVDEAVLATTRTYDELVETVADAIRVRAGVAACSPSACEMSRRTG